MRTSHLRVLASLALVSLATYGSAFAGNRADTVTLTVGAGGEFFAKKRHIENTGVPFIDLGYSFTNHWGVEGLLGGFITNASKSVAEHDNRQVKGTLFLLDGIYHFSPDSFKGFEPLVLAGVGVTGISPNGTNANNEGNINLGVGAQFFSYHSIALRVEARDIYTIIGGKNDVMVDAGVSFLMGGCGPVC